MEKKTNLLQWMLFGIRLFVGTIFIMHGGQKLLCHLGHRCWLSGSTTWTHGGILCLAPVVEILGGGLIATGILIELGTILIVPGIILFLFITILNAGFNQTNLRFMLNLMMLAIAIGICGPGKWALWDPGKTRREKFLKAKD